MISVVGCGFWGPNFIRISNNLKTLKWVVDTDENQLKKIKKLYPNVKTTTKFSDVLEDKEISGVIIATPANTHHVLAKQALEADKNVLVEKPFTTTVKQCEELIQIAEERNLVLMVGHTFLYHPFILELKNYLENGKLGDIYYIYSTRVNLGQIRGDINAMWNLAPHDVSIVNYFIGKNPIAVRATGRSYLQENVHDVVFMDIEYPGKIMVHIHVSWLDPAKIRKLIVVGSQKMAIFDDMKEDKLVIFDKGLDRITEDTRFSGVGKFKKRYGDMETPKVEFKEPLKQEFEHFLDCIKHQKKSLTDGQNALQVIKVLEAAQKSLENNGERFTL